MCQHPPEAGVPASRECPDCGTVVGVLDDRGAARRLAHGPDGRIGEVMAEPDFVNAYTASLRPAGGGREWTVRQADLVYCDADGTELPAGEPS